MTDGRASYHIDLLASELENRKRKNQRYSLRAFAAFLRIDPSTLSKILNGKAELSIPNCIAILKKLELTPDQKKLFIASVAEDRMMRASKLLASAIDGNFLGEATHDISTKITDLNRKETITVDSILSVTPEPIAIFDLEGKFIYSNPACAKVFEQFPSQLIGKSPQELNCPADVVLQLNNSREETLKSKKEHRSGIMIPGQKATRYFEMIFVPVFTNGEVVRAALCTLRDITQQKKSEEQRKFLFEASKILGSSLDYQSTIDQIVKLVVPKYADWSLLHVRGENGQPKRVAVATAFPDRVIDIVKFDEFVPILLADNFGPGAVIRTGQPVFYERAKELNSPQDQRTERFLEIIRLLEVESSIGVPLIHNGVSFGSIMFTMTDTKRIYKLSDLEFFMEYGQLATSALENAKKYSEGLKKPEITEKR